MASRIRGKELDVILSENPAVKVLGSHSMSRTASWRDDVRNGMQALILQNKGKFQGVWASLDGQAWIIDDLLRAQGYKKGDVCMVSIDGGEESIAASRIPRACFTATVAHSVRVDGPDGGREARQDRGQEDAAGTGRAADRTCGSTRCWSMHRNVDKYASPSRLAAVIAWRRCFASSGIGKRYGAVEALRGRRPRRRAGRGARDLRRQRRRQVDA